MEGKYHVYVIECKELKRYIGLSSNVEKRVRVHNERLSFWTKRYHGWKIIYKKEFDNYTEARRWELHLKKQKGGIGLKKELRSYSGVEQSGSSCGS